MHFGPRSFIEGNSSAQMFKSGTLKYFDGWGQSKKISEPPAD